LAVFSKKKEDNAVEVSVKDLQREDLGPTSYHCYVADLNGDVVGWPWILNRTSTWKGPIIQFGRI